METIGLLVTLEARQGKEADAEAFLKSAQPLAQQEKGTLKWYTIKQPSAFKNRNIIPPPPELI